MLDFDPNLTCRPQFAAALHALLQAESLDQFVAQGERLLQFAMPFHSLCISLNSLESFSPALIRDTRLPAPCDAAYMSERYHEFDPTPHFLRQHVGVAQSTLREHLRTLPLQQRAHYCERFMRHEGWASYAEIYFWQGRNLEAVLCVRRTAAQPAFTAGDLRFLGTLRECLAGCVSRLHRQQRERAVAQSLHAILLKLPLPLIVLDGALRPCCFSFEARRLCVDWQHGEAAARAVKGEFIPDVPREILAACATHLNSTGDKRATAHITRISHPLRPELFAQIERCEDPDPRRGRLHLLVRFHKAAPTDHSLGSDRSLSLLAGLTRCEREIACLVRDGLTNRDIAVSLRKSEATVKMQVHSSFRKLGVRNRTQLAGLLR